MHEKINLNNFEGKFEIRPECRKIRSSNDQFWQYVSGRWECDENRECNEKKLVEMETAIKYMDGYKV